MDECLLNPFFIGMVGQQHSDADMPTREEEETAVPAFQDAFNEAFQTASMSINKGEREICHAMIQFCLIVQQLKESLVAKLLRKVVRNLFYSPLGVAGVITDANIVQKEYAVS